MNVPTNRKPVDPRWRALDSNPDADACRWPTTVPVPPAVPKREGQR